MDSTLKRYAKYVVIFLAGIVAQQSISHTKAWFEHRYEDLRQEVRELQVQADTLTTRNGQLQRQIDSLMNMHPYRKRKHWTCKDGTFFGFVLYTPVDTSICRKFALALSDYSGPKVRVNSIRRHSNRHSDHYHGKAVDFELSNDLVSWLLSPMGKEWCTKHSLHFYIEGKPGSRKVKSYLSDPIASKHIFFNPLATGDHIHLAQT